MGMDNLMYYYANNSFDTEMGEAFKNHANWPKDLSLPYFYKGSNILLKKFSDLEAELQQHHLVFMDHKVEIFVYLFQYPIYMNNSTPLSMAI